MYLLSLDTFNFRNLHSGPITWGRGVNLILGHNGQGKSNLLEALTVLGNLRSFRGVGWRVMIRHGESEARLAARIEGSATGPTTLDQLVAIDRPIERQLTAGSRKVAPGEYLWICPLFVVAPDDSDLVVGPPQVRRLFLDRFAFLLDPRMLPVVRRFQRALRQRNAALRSRASTEELDAWDAALARTAARLVHYRRSVIQQLEPAFQKLYRECCSDGFPDVELGYAPEGWLDRDNSPQILEESYQKRYNATRARDCHAGFTVEGPHRHDLLLRATGRPARNVLSSGQVRVVATALRLATVTIVEEQRGERFPVAIDDVDATLDRTVLARLSEWLTSGRQVFLSSARGDAVASHFPDSQTLWIQGGVASRA